MPNRGNGRGRGGRGGTFKIASRNNDRESILDRLGGKVVYANKGTNIATSKKYKFVRSQTETACVAVLPQEQRIKVLAKKFLKTYYEIFDTPGRLGLESQYSADAFFSFSATFPMPTVGRNLLEVPDPENRIRLLVHDKTNIAAALTSFSPTEHLVDTLSCDVPFYIVNPMYVVSMQLVVSGVFKDTAQTTNNLKAFTRVFVIKQSGVDKTNEPIYAIFNDLFMLKPPTPEQIKKYHHDLAIEKRLSGNADRSNSSSSNSAVRSQDEMVTSIMNKTQMNRNAARQLLQENNWEEAKSMEVFNILSSTNKIPQEYFAP